MLRRLNVRTRLVAVVTVPLALLMAVVVPAALTSRGQAADADQAAAVTGAASDIAAVTDAVEAERTLSAARRAGADPAAVKLLAARRAATDAAVNRAEDALVAMDGLDPSVRVAVAQVREHLLDLRSVRLATDTTDSVVPWVDPFSPLVGSLLDLQDAVGAAVGELGAGRGLSKLVLVARAKEAAALQDAEVAAAASWEELRGSQAGTLNELRGREAAYRLAYLTALPAPARAAAQQALDEPRIITAGDAVDRVATGQDIGELDAWFVISASRQAGMQQIAAEILDSAARDAARAGVAARTSTRTDLALAGAALVGALGLALAVSRSITRPLREVTIAADQLAVDRLPRLVDALRRPPEGPEHQRAPVLTPIVVTGRDDFARLARSLNTVQSVAVEAANEQAKVLKKGISELYVNLARRNQALIDRQINLLDELERGEQDVEVLRHLYLLDHLATRMRRNAESLLVLAGSEPGRRRSKPIGITDVVRAALSEIEDYPRVELGTVEAATLHGPAVSDVAHLVAELLENATQLSPPDTQVRVDGAHSDGSYRLTIVDEGVGMRPEQLSELNAILREPPVTGLAHGRSLGCLVAARLAARHGIAVRLAAGSPQGVVATVVLPGRLLVADATTTDGIAGPVAAPAPAALAAPPAPPAPELAPRAPSPVEERRGVATPVPGVRLPARLRDTLPAHAAFEADIKALFDSETAPTTPVPPVAGSTQDPVLAGVAADLASSLHRREPGATTELRPEPPTTPPLRRSPDEVRGLLSRYRSGLQAGRLAAGSANEERP